VKIRIKKKQVTIEEARTFQDATTNLGKFKGRLVAKLKEIYQGEEEDIERLSLSVIENMKFSIPEKFRYGGKEYEIPDGDRVSFFDWLKTLTLNNTNQILYLFTEGPIYKSVSEEFAMFMLSKKHARKKTIAQVKDVLELQELVKDSFEIWASKEDKKREKEGFKGSDQNIEKLVSPDQNWEILLPHDKQAAIYLGQICRSTWCTAARSSENMFQNYYKKNDPLFVIKHKTEKQEAEVKNPQTRKMETVTVPVMYEVSFGSEQFKDRKNEEVPKETVKFLLDLIQNSKTEDGKPVKEKYPVVENIKIQQTEEGLLMFTKNKYGDQEWFLNGKRHRTDGPAVIEAGGEGIVRWFNNGYLHREDGPASKAPNGAKGWYLKDKLIVYTSPDDFSTPPEFIEAGGKEWDWKNDPWNKRDNTIKMDFGGVDLDNFIPEQFSRFRKLWS
jgi:hypothetical protein